MSRNGTRSILAGRTPDLWTRILGLGVVAAFLAAVGVIVNTSSYDTAIAIVVFIALIVIFLPIFRRIAVIDNDETLVRILVAGLILKLIFSLIRFWVIFKLYGGVGDASRYDGDGWRVVESIRNGTPLPVQLRTLEGEAGTAQIIWLTAYIYMVIGRSMFGAFFIFAALAFVGALLFWRGAMHAFPELDRKRLLILLLFWPSILFWPSSIGKDAIMILLLGVATYGAGLLLAPKTKPVGIIPFMAALGGMLLIRPHVGLMAVLALALAAVFAVVGGESSGRSARATASRVAALGIICLGALVASSQTSRFFDDNSKEATSTEDALNMAAKRTSIGNSKFTPIPITSPATLPAGTYSVLFRPFPWEARSAGVLIAAGEGQILLLLIIVSLGRLRGFRRALWNRPIIIFALSYTMLFVIAFSTFGNSAILARQRIQLLPFVMIVVSLPRRVSAGKKAPPSRSSDVAAKQTMSPRGNALDSPTRIDQSSMTHAGEPTWRK